MLKYDRAALEKILVEEEHYSETVAEQDADTLVNLDARLQGALDAYLTDRTITDTPFVEGVTLKAIMEKDRCNFFSALGSMSVFLKEPELAKRYLATPRFFRGKPKAKR